MQNIDHEIDKQEEQGKVYTDGYVVSVVFVGNSKPYYFHTYDNDIKENQPVIVETIHGVELGTVVRASTPIKEFKEGLLLRPVIRKAFDADLESFKNNLEKSKDALLVTQECVDQLGLDMRLLRASYTLDASKITIVYASEGRVDFRELLKELASKLHCRIELRQIGSRDRSKVIGGLGVCGLPICCNAFLSEFDGISINIAKNQFLVLNIQKLSGHCGKLLCCLKYENDDYTELRKGLPKIGQRVMYDNEQYRVGSINVLTRHARLENKEHVQIIDLDELVKLAPKIENNNEEGK